MNLGVNTLTHTMEPFGAQNGSALRYDDYCVRELAFDIGVDPNALKNKLKMIWQNGEAELHKQHTDTDNQIPMQFHL